MNYKDYWVTDDEGKRFVFTVEMQRALEKEGLPVEPGSLELINQSSREPRPARVAEDRRSAESEEPATIQIDPQTGKYLGRLKWFNPTKGYGFIARGGGEDIFFHKSSATIDPSTLDEGDWVLYDVEERRKGLEAAEVERYQGELPG